MSRSTNKLEASAGIGSAVKASVLAIGALILASSQHVAWAGAPATDAVDAAPAGTTLDRARPNTVFGSYSFPANGLNGASPVGGVVEVGGLLYGATQGGGAGCAANQHCGTVYKINPVLAASSQGIVHSFPSSSTDGSNPSTMLLSVGQYLYGGAFYGGASVNCCGTLFRVKTNGSSYQTLWTSTGIGNDPQAPVGNLLKLSGSNSNPTILAMTQYGGSSGNGTLLTYSAGTENTVHEFGAATGDGQWPSRIIKVGSDLYGTTSFGGDQNCGPQASCGHGTVFRMDAAGNYVWKYNFGSYGGDGWYPFAGVVKVGIYLYGITYEGGSANSGTIFRIRASDGQQEQVLYNFTQAFQSTDGFFPAGGLTYDAPTGILYGTTTYGGDHTACSGGCGTVFGYTLPATPNSFSTVYRFSGPTDGSRSDSPLLDIGGTLYGTAPMGGTGGKGTVFYVTP